MQALASDPVESPSINWLIIRYPGPTISTNGKVNAELDSWIEKTGSFIQTMAKYCGLRAAAVLLPLRWPLLIDNLCTREMKSEGWCRRIGPLRNSDHGGPIETNHQLVVVMPASLASHFSVPTVTVEKPSSLTIIDEMTGHVDGEFQGRGISTERLLQDVFHFFCRYGLPKIIYVDADGKFAGLFKGVLSSSSSRTVIYRRFPRTIR